ncbi:cytochrome c oxidase assembly protein [Rhodoblastus acidophilus]|uniref:cytochrome c oxidase assembly protein n=1 Tax=Rhodoblastus acidophilus TaxID=1074 RepID=UPI003CCFFABC
MPGANLQGWIVANWPAKLARGWRLSFFSALQMTALGALLTLAPHTLFSLHVLSASAWGLTPLEDQQLGGLIMWVRMPRLRRAQPGGLHDACMGPARNRATKA